MNITMENSQQYRETDILTRIQDELEEPPFIFIAFPCRTNYDFIMTGGKVF
jgi:hypothetical protein